MSNTDQDQDFFKTHKVTQLNIFVLLLITFIIVFVMSSIILYFSDTPIPNTFGNGNIWGYIAPSAIAGILCTFALLVPNIPVGDIEDENSEIVEIFEKKFKAKAPQSQQAGQQPQQPGQQPQQPGQQPQQPGQQSQQQGQQSQQPAQQLIPAKPITSSIMSSSSTFN
jgi:hypothetical protein